MYLPRLTFSKSCGLLTDAFLPSSTFPALPILSSNCIGLSTSFLSIILTSNKQPNKKNSSFFSNDISLTGAIGSNATSDVGFDSILSRISTRIDMKILEKCIIISNNYTYIPINCIDISNFYVTQVMTKRVAENVSVFTTNGVFFIIK